MKLQTFFHSLFPLLPTLFFKLSAGCECGVLPAGSGMSRSIKEANNSDHQRIIHGEPTKASDWPFFLHLRIKKPGETTYCGASLITDSWAVTAAHCVYVGHQMVRPKATNLYLGLNSAKHLEDAELRPVKLIVTPPFKNIDSGFDIALLQLKYKVDLGQFPPICLPEQDAEPAANEGIVIGHGNIHAGDSFEVPRQLMKAKVKLITKKSCEEYYTSFPQWVLCVGGRHARRATCQGDSGGPLLVEREKGSGKYDLVGITSFGPRGCLLHDKLSYGGFTAVSSYIKWIKESMESHGGEGSTCY